MKQGIGADEILNVLPSKYYVVHLDSREIVQSNDSGVQIRKSKCFQYFYGKDEPCENPENCICRQANKKESQSCTITLGEGSESQSYRARVSAFNENHVVVSLENITDELKFKKELKINSKRLERAERLAAFGYWEFNVDEKVMIASTGAMNIYGVSSSRISLEEVQTYPLRKYRKKLNRELENLIHSGKSYNIKFQIKRPVDGEIRCIHSIAEYREDKHMVFGVIHDITETEKAQKALVENQNNLKHLFSNMNSGFAFHKIITDKQGKPVDYVFLDVNTKFEKIIGVKREKIINKRILEVLPQTEKIWIERYGEVALTGNPITFSDYSGILGKHFEVAAYSPQKNYFAITFTDISERVKSEKALKESLLELKMAQQFAKIGSWKYSMHDQKIYWSDQVFEIWERDPALGVIDVQEYKNYYSEQDLGKLSAALEKTLTTGAPLEIQIQLQLPGNKQKWVEIICRLPQDFKQQANNVVLHGTIQDITESKNAEEELSKTNQLLRTVIDNIPDAIYMKDVHYRKLIANKGDAINCGVSGVEEIIGKTDYELYPKDIADVYTSDDRKVIENGETIINREEVLPSGDKNRVILTSKFPLKDQENNIIGLVGIGRDITELKENQSRLNLLMQTIRQTPLSLVITNTKGDIQYVNPGFTKVTGYEYNEVIGKNPRILQAGVTEKIFYKNLWKTITSGKNWYGEFCNKRKDGTLYWESAVIAPIFGENQKLEHYVAIKEDITEKKQIVEDLKIAKEKAEESSRLKSIFLTNLSHEIRTPLNGILGFSSIICSGVSDPEKLNYYGDIIEKSGRRLIKVIDDIIEMSMLQSNQIKVEHEAFDLNEVLQELFDLYKDLYVKKIPDINFSVQLCEDKNHILVGDKNKVKHVLENLLDNAFKFTPNGFIHFGYFDSDHKKITLFVKDSGIGIGKEKSEIIFEPFRQVEEGDSRKYEGSGLGLAISAAIMNKLGGSIQLESKVEKGSVFYLKFRKDLKMQ